MNTRAIILAAGKGTRMKSETPKVLHKVCGKPMLGHVVDNLKASGVEDIYAVLGHKADMVQAHFGDAFKTVIQKEQLGTGHAVMQFESQLEGADGQTVVICGDTPLISDETIRGFIDHHKSSGAKATVLTATTDNPHGYGRIIRNESGTVERIVEEKDATDEERSVTEINTGTFVFDNKSLFNALKAVTNDNAQGEYYLPDVLKILREENETVAAFACEDFSETIGINDRVALAVAEETLRQTINLGHMKNGVTLIDPKNTYIDKDVTIGNDTIIHPNVTISGQTTIGNNVSISPSSEIVDSNIGNNVTIRQSVIHGSVVGDSSNVGPFAQLRPESNLGKNIKIGNFVEVKKSTLEDDVKVSHLSYIGDASIGENTNVGCGSITVNYDGKNKHLTTIGRDSFIGCNSNLVAPVTIGDNSFIAAGSTITNDVPNDSLAIGRSRQTNKEDYYKN